MKKLSLLVLFCCLSGIGRSQQQFNLPLLSNWDDDAIPNAWTGAFSECWGYAHNGREYAFIGSTQGTYFFDITDASSPHLVDFIRTKDTVALVVNKDYATYSHYLYAVSDQGENSLQIFDLQYLPDSVVVAYDDDAISKRCHTIFVENDRLYMCSVTGPQNSHSNMSVYSLADPVNPALLGSLPLSSYNVHEVFVMNDTAYCAMGYNGLWIYDFTNPAAPQPISALTNYPENGYNHSAWLTADGKVMAFTDENHGKGVKLYNMADIEDPQLYSIFRSNLLQVSDPGSSNGSVAHNPYIFGNTLLVSYYHDGIAAYDISNPSSPQRIAYYDTHPQDTAYFSYKGCWGLYPFLPSGNIIASDINNGLFIFKGQHILNFNPEELLPPSVNIGQNPVENEVELIYTGGRSRQVEVTVYDYTGRLVADRRFTMLGGSGRETVPVTHLSAGAYVLRMNAGDMVLTRKFIKVKTR